MHVALSAEQSNLVYLYRLTFRQLPNLWALVTALTMDNTALRQRDRSHIVFTTLLVMCCSGRSSMSQIGSWVSNYFDSQHSKGS